MEFESCSVIVPSVLEMTKDPNMVTVPSRYIQLEQDQDQANVDLNSSSDDFPVINFQNLSLPISHHNSQLYQSELTKLHLACKNWGFFQLVNHSVSNSVVEKMKEEVKKLFELPIEEREKLWQRPGEVEGFGHTFVFNDEQKVNWKDDLFLFILPHALRNPNLFPKLPSSLREILEIYSLELAKLAKSIISQMEKVLGLENKEISKLVEDGMQSINMINYPPCPQPEKVIGVKPHSDTAILTILLQANQVEGLQVKKDDKWVLVKPLPNAFIVNVGDIIELVNHGVSNSVVEKMKEEVEKLFKMPIEEKEKLWQRPGEVEGFGHTFVFSEEQKLNWKDDLYLFTLPQALRNPHLFPKLPPSLREILEIYSLELAKLAKDIISQIEKVLGIENKEISKLFEDGMQSINMINYPPCPQPEKVIGVKPHSDTVALTILLQANQVQGLQVKKDGKWVLVKPLPNAFIVNVGDILEILTNGLYPSIEHRVVVNPKQERLSIATFLNTNLDCDIGPASSLITQQNPPKYKTVTSKEYIKGVFSNEPDGKAYVDIMKLY